MKVINFILALRKYFIDLSQPHPLNHWPTIVKDNPSKTELTNNRTFKIYRIHMCSNNFRRASVFSISVGSEHIFFNLAAMCGNTSKVVDILFSYFVGVSLEGMIFWKKKKRKYDFLNSSDAYMITKRTTTKNMCTLEKKKWKLHAMKSFTGLTQTKRTEHS